MITIDAEPAAVELTFNGLKQPEPQLKFLEVAVIVDIDGNIADNTWRGPFEWHKVSGDYPRQDVIWAARAFRKAGARLLFVSGRMEQCREKTLAWLREFVTPGVLSHDLFMRADDDYRPDTATKSEIYDKYIDGKFAVVLVLDDRKSVVKMWREEKGLTVLQSAEGDF